MIAIDIPTHIVHTEWGIKIHVVLLGAGRWCEDGAYSREGPVTIRITVSAKPDSDVVSCLGGQQSEKVLTGSVNSKV